MKKNTSARRAAIAAACLSLGPCLCATARAGAPVPLGEREMAGLYAQGLAAPVVDALSRLPAAPAAAGPSTDPDSPASASFTGLLLTALSAEAARGLDRQLAAQELQAASGGLQATINLSGLMVDAAKFQAPLAGLAGPLPILPFLFALPVLPVLPVLPTLPPPDRGNGGGH